MRFTYLVEIPAEDLRFFEDQITFSVEDLNGFRKNPASFLWKVVS